MDKKAELYVGKIKQMMADRGMGPEDVARKIGVCGEMVRNWLQTGEASYDRANDLARALGSTLTEITV